MVCPSQKLAYLRQLDPHCFPDIQLLKIENLSADLHFSHSFLNAEKEWVIRLPGESLLFPELVNRIFTLLPADDAPLREKFIPILQEFGKILEEMENVVPKDSHSYRAILSWKTKELLLKKDAWKVIK